MLVAKRIKKRSSDLIEASNPWRKVLLPPAGFAGAKSVAASRINGRERFFDELIKSNATAFAW